MRGSPLFIRFVIPLGFVVPMGILSASCLFFWESFYSWDSSLFVDSSFLTDSSFFTDSSFSRILPFLGFLHFAVILRRTFRGRFEVSLSVQLLSQNHGIPRRSSRLHNLGGPIHPSLGTRDCDWTDSPTPICSCKPMTD